MNRKLLFIAATALSIAFVFTLVFPKLAAISMGVVLVIGVYGAIREHRKIMAVIKGREDSGR